MDYDLTFALSPLTYNLHIFLGEFIDQHPGVRLGRMFGMPAGYVGRRLFACVMEEGLLVRLPDEIARRELKGQAKPFSRRSGRPLGSWVIYRPRTSVAAQRLTRILEVAARNVAERS
jgi:hypothetical protein